MRELTDGVYALEETIDRGGETAGFHPAAVATDRGALLLDVGFEDETDQLRDELAAAGFDWDDVWAVLVTHQDGDHAGALDAVCDRTGAVVFAHEACAPFVDGRKDPIKGDGDRYPPVPVDVELTDGAAFRTAAGPMRVAFTPGHAPGHVSLYFPEENLLIAADALTAADGCLQGPSERFTLDMAEAAASVERLAELDVDDVLCYHGGFVTDVGDRVSEIAAAFGT